MQKNPNRNLCDLARKKRTNIPEVVFGKSKDNIALIDATNKILNGNGKVLATKCSRKQINILRKKYGAQVRKYDNVSGTVIISVKPLKNKQSGSVAILAAGASDYFVAEEAALTAEFLGMSTLRYYDCGVAGIHRVVGPIKDIINLKVDVVIVVAGMEGALPSIISGLIKQPVIAVPTSVGYGTSFNGVTALLSMLNTCSPGVSVVNIDNGFGAAICACKMVLWLRGIK